MSQIDGMASPSRRFETVFRTILMNTLSRISDVVKPWVELQPDRPALVEASGTWTYRQFALIVADTQAWLLASGVRPGDRVMIVCENCRAFVAILLALSELDAWPVLVNARLSASEVDAIRDHCQARRVDLHHERVAPCTRTRQAARSGGPGGGWSRSRSRLGPLNERVEPEPIDADVAQRVAALIYTSGTTGLPKGVMLTSPEPAVCRSGVRQDSVAESG